MDKFLTFTIVGLTISAIYAVIASGLVLTYTTTGIFNFAHGAVGMLGTKPSADMMAGCDTLLMVGTTFPYAEYLPKPGQARGVQIDRVSPKTPGP